MNNFPLTTDMAVRAKGGSIASYTNASGQLVTLPIQGQGNTANNSESFRTYNGFGHITSMITTPTGTTTASKPAFGCKTGGG